MKRRKSVTRFVLAVYSACFDPPPVRNSVLRYDERESGVFVTYRCNSGFAFESGSFEETLECLSETKTWDRYLGDCKRNPPNNYTTAKKQLFFNFKSCTALRWGETLNWNSFRAHHIKPAHTS